MAIKTCQARQYSDQTHCQRCDLTWDTNDYEPPACKTNDEIAKTTLANLKRQFADRDDALAHKGSS